LLQVQACNPITGGNHDQDNGGARWPCRKARHYFQNKKRREDGTQAIEHPHSQHKIMSSKHTATQKRKAKKGNLGMEAQACCPHTWVPEGGGTCA
jgi:hypothetical protein